MTQGRPLRGRSSSSRHGTVGLVVLGLGIVAVVVIVAVVGIGIVWTSVLRSLDPEPHRAVLDELQIPATWELAHEEIVQSVLFGSRVERYYLVDADPSDVLSPAESIFTRAGFATEIRRAPTDWCDTRPLNATPALVCPEQVIPPCSTNGPSGPMTCFFYARRGQECVAVDAYDRGEGAVYYRGMDAQVISDPIRIVVRLIDYYPGPFPCQ